MLQQIKHIVRITCVILAGIALITSAQACKAKKCDCPNFGGHHLNHNT